MSPLPPTVGRIVHYRSYGTPGGEFTPECRAAVITQVLSESTVGLAVLNPTGLFFHDADQDETTQAGGTWHWPEIVK